MSSRPWGRARDSVALPVIGLLALSLIVAPGGAGGDTKTSNIGGESPGEALHYRWRLTGALGALAGLFLPRQGSGLLTSEPNGAGGLQTQLRIESEKSREGEFWEYGAEIEAASGETRRVWSAYRWRGDESSKEENLEAIEAVDIVSGIWLLRQAPPEVSQNLEIWSDGKLYPVLVLPGETTSTIVCNERRNVRHYTVRGLQIGDRDRWRGRLELWLADDPAATPVQLIVDRGWARVRMDLTGSDARAGGSTNRRPCS